VRRGPAEQAADCDRASYAPTMLPASLTVGMPLAWRAPPLPRAYSTLPTRKRRVGASLSARFCVGIFFAD
jgi:hypothetical protein